MRICLIKTSALGDIVQTFPVVHYLRTCIPTAMIDWVVERANAQLVQSHPLVNQVIAVDTRQWRAHPLSRSTAAAISQYRNAVRQSPYDVVFDLQGNLKSGLLTLAVKSKQKVGFGWKYAPEWFNGLFTNYKFTPMKDRNIRDDYLSLAHGWLRDIPKQPENSIAVTGSILERGTQLRQSNPRALAQPKCPLFRLFGYTGDYRDPGIALTISEQQKRGIDKLLSSPELQQGLKILVSAGSAWRNKQLPIDTLRTFLQRLGANYPCSFLFAWGSTDERTEAEQLHSAFPYSSLVVDRLPLAVLQNLMHRIDLVIAMDSLPLHLAGSAGTPTFAPFGPSLAAKYNPPGPNHGSMQGPCPYGRTFNKRCPILRTCPTGACLRSLQADELFASFSEWWTTYTP